MGIISPPGCNFRRRLSRVTELCDRPDWWVCAYEWRSLYTTLDVDGGTVGAYATAFAGGFYINAAATGVFNDYESHRDALLGDAQGDTNGRDFNGLVAAGYEWKSGG